MNFATQARISSTNRFAPLTDWEGDDERTLQDFFGDISLSADEMRLYIAMPEYSIADVRNLIADVKNLRAARKIVAASRASSAP